MILFILAAFSLVHLGTSVVVQKVVVPEQTLSGHTARLGCTWSAGSGPPLYSLRWCKDGTQFFVVTLRPKLRKTVFPALGIQVVVGASNEYAVRLTNVTALTSGIYTCEAMSDAPDFFSSACSAYLPVIEVPADGPTWTGVLSAYHVNQQLHAHCQVFGSRPPAVFTFFLNDHRITDEDGWVMKHKPSRNTRDMIWNSSSTLSIHLNSESIKTLFPKSLPQYHSYILQETRRNMSSGNPKSNIHYRLQWQEPYSSHDAAPYSNNPFTPPYTHTHSERRSAHESLYSLSSISPIASSYSRPSSVARDLYSSLPSKNQKINLTCVANIGGLSLKTSTWTLLSFPTELHFSSKSRLSENSGPTLAPSPCLQAITVLCLTVNAGFKGFLLNLARYD